MENQELEPKVEKKDPTVDALLGQINEMKKNTVSKEDYDKILADNAKLVKEVTNNRQTLPDNNDTLTPSMIVKRCEKRNELIGQANSYESVKALCENYRDMKTLGMDVSYVDEGVVGALEKIVEDAKGSPELFNALMDSKIKVK